MKPPLPIRGSLNARTGAAIALTGLIAACAAEPEAQAAYLDLDCAQAFEAQTTALVAQAKLNPAPVEPAEPYRFYSSADGRTSYLVTQPTAPAHPAIMMQKARGSDVITTGCAYGDLAAYDELLAYLDSLKTWTRK
ncbi:MAG: hypothetical protein U1C74_19995 [Phenylobacterium sp.]|nr:hypothetical protein [Phenylobacterium sp.]